MSSQIGRSALNYRRGFWRLGVVLTLAEIVFFVGLVIWGTLILPLLRADVLPPNWSEFRRGVLTYGALPVGAYWLMYWVLGWVVRGFEDNSNHPE